MAAKLVTLDAEIEAHNSTLESIKTTLKSLQGQTVETETTKESINAMLRDSEMQGFSLQPKAGVDHVYKVHRPDGNIADNLSKSEKNFIAFLYFYHLVYGSDSAEGEAKGKIVVIDDPVSSMDSGSLFIVSTSVRHWTRVRTNNAIESLNREIRHRTRVMGGFPDSNSALIRVCARFRHVTDIRWDNKKYMNMKQLKTALEDVSIAIRLHLQQSLQTKVQKILNLLTPPALLAPDVQ